jgi:general secretion pathway protein I
MKMHLHRRNTRRGFTLIEVMVALLVLALAMSALQVRISQTLDSASYLRDKTIAQWVALNQLEILRISSRFGNAPPQQQLTGTAAMAGRTWYWVMTPQVSPDIEIGTAAAISSPSMVLITVSAENIETARASPLVSMTGVTDAWHGL